MPELRPLVDLEAAQMMRYTCQACQFGEHDMCAGKNPPPPGMMGGSECDCDGNCAARATEKEQSRFAALLAAAGEQSKQTTPESTEQIEERLLTQIAAQNPTVQTDHYSLAKLIVSMVAPDLAAAYAASELPSEEQALAEEIFLLSAGADWQRRAEGVEARLEHLERAIADYLDNTEFPHRPPANRLRTALASKPLKTEIVFDMIERWRADAKRPWRRGQGSRG